MTDTALLAVLLAAIAGLLAGRAWAAARRRGDSRDRPPYRVSPHYTQGLHYVAAGQRELATAALDLMESRKITVLVVADSEGGVDGLVHLHDLWKTEMI